MIEVMVGGNSSDNVDAGLVCGFANLVDVVRVDCGGLVGDVVDEEVRVVVFANGNGDDLHLAGRGCRESCTGVSKPWWCPRKRGNASGLDGLRMRKSV